MAVLVIQSKEHSKEWCVERLREAFIKKVGVDREMPEVVMTYGGQYKIEYPDEWKINNLGE